MSVQAVLIDIDDDPTLPDCANGLHVGTIAIGCHYCDDEGPLQIETVRPVVRPRPIVVPGTKIVAAGKR